MENKFIGSAFLRFLIKSVLILIVSIVVGFIMFILSTSSSSETVVSGLTWSVEQGNMDWDTATITCKNLGQRLPNSKELKEALNSQLLSDELNSNSFREGKKYWSSLRQNFTELYFAGWYYHGDVIINAEKKKFEHAVRCVQ